MAKQKSTVVKEVFKVDEKLEKEFEKALTYELQDEDIKRARLPIGVNVASRQRELFSEATPDAIRNWAQGVGDDNALYTEESYGPRTRWGSQTGMGTMVGHVRTRMLGDPMPRKLKQATKGLFRGIHVFVSGGTWDWYRPIYPGGRFLVDLEMRMVNQRDTETAYGSATVSLPTRAVGLPPLPPVPVELQREAAAMFARHNELTAEQQRRP